MITGKYINLVIVVLLLNAVIFTSVLMASPEKAETAVQQSSQPQYVSKLFAEDKIISMDIKVDETEWKNMLDNATKEEYIPCDVTINGTTFTSVGIRPKGNSSLSTVAGSDSDRFSFKFEFDQYIEGQTCFGLDKLVINNVQSDATYMKEYMSYELMNYIGVATPLHAYTDVKVNGKDWGFYIAVEAIEESFAQRNFGTDHGMLYKPESMGARGNGMMNNFLNNKNTNASNTKNVPENQIAPDQQSNQNTRGNRDFGNVPGGDMQGGFPGGSGGSSGGTDLKYSDDNVSSYSNIFDNQVFEGTTADYSRVIEALKNLNSSTALEKYVNVDEVLKYIAVNTFTVNLDSYFSSMKHNYYLYEDNGQLSMLPWDYNLAFAGFQSGTASSAVNFPIDTPVSGIELSERPMVAKLLEVPEYKKKYHQYLKQIADDYVKNGTFETTVDKLDQLIAQYVQKDASAFFTYDQYTAAVPALKEFAQLRAESIEGQLDGTIPSTTDGQTSAKEKLVDASGLNLTDMGSQGGPGFGGAKGQQDNTQRSGNDTGNKDNQQNGAAGGNGPGGDMFQNMPDRDTMMKAMQILQSANGGELTDDQLNQLKDLGLTDDQIETLKNMGNQFGGTGMRQGGGFGNDQAANGNGMQPPDGMNFGAPGAQGAGAGTTSGNINTLTIVVSIILLSAGLLFVIRFKRRRYSE